MESRVDLAELSEAHQDYLKVLWDHDEYVGGPTSMGVLVERTGQKKSTVTEAVKRMAAGGLVDYTPYFGVALSARGRALATQMVRRHRLVETLLVTTFGYGLDEVHEDAEIIEHAVTERFVNRIDKFLGYPTRDPHGDPIPAADGKVEPLSGRSLADVGEGGRAVVEQVSDRDSEVLRYLLESGIAPGAELEVVSRMAGIAQVEVLRAGRLPSGADSAGASEAQKTAEGRGKVVVVPLSDEAEAAVRIAP